MEQMSRFRRSNRGTERTAWSVRAPARFFQAEAVATNLYIALDDKGRYGGLRWDDRLLYGSLKGINFIRQ